MIDANIAAYATYFDGVLSADRKLIALHREARHILSKIGGTVLGLGVGPAARHPPL